MRHLSIALLLACWLTAPWPPRPAVAEELLPGPSEAGWRTQAILGWTVHVSRRFQSADEAAVAEALQLTEQMLAEIIRVMPPNATAQLRQVPLYFSPVYPGFKPKAEYHISANYLREHGRDPAMAGAVEFSNVNIFAAAMRRMPNFVLHELAHAYHDRVLGFDEASVLAAYERAKAGGKYDSVIRRDSEGNERSDRAYALTNAHEYFAETSEAYFVRNDFFPFTRDELQTHDPVMFDLLPQLWDGAARTSELAPP